MLLFDPLSIFFLFVILAVSAPSAVYSYGYLKNEYPRRKIILGWFLLASFVLSMALVVSVNNILIFLVAWEIMSLVSYFLVVFDWHHEKSVKAGLIYIVMTHIGTAFLTAAFLLMYRYAHSFDFFVVKDACQIMPAQVKNILFLLLLLGFGTKAGIVPMHTWLPDAHSQAVSPISALLSGVLLKTAIYAILRFGIIVIHGVGFTYFSNLMILFGVISLIISAGFILVQKDLKRLLAYSSIEHIGIISIGFGIGAPIAIAGALLHVFNHAVTKSLMFFGAGNIVGYYKKHNLNAIRG